MYVGLDGNDFYNVQPNAGIISTDTAKPIILLTNNVTVAKFDQANTASTSTATGAFTVTGGIGTTGAITSTSQNIQGTGSGTISILPQTAAGTYNLNLPTTAGTAGKI